MVATPHYNLSRPDACSRPKSGQSMIFLNLSAGIVGPSGVTLNTFSTEESHMLRSHIRTPRLATALALASLLVAAGAAPVRAQDAVSKETAAAVKATFIADVDGLDVLTDDDGRD